MPGNINNDTYIVNHTLVDGNPVSVVDLQDSAGRKVPQFVKEIQIKNLTNPLFWLRDDATDNREYGTGITCGLLRQETLHNLERMQISGTTGDSIVVEYQI